MPEFIPIGGSDDRLMRLFDFEPASDMEKSMSPHQLRWKEAQAQMKQGHYPCERVLLPRDLKTDPLFQAKKEVWKYAIAHQLGLTVSADMEGIALEHVAELPSSQSLYQALRITHHQMESQDGRPVRADDEYSATKLVFSETGEAGTESFDPQLFRVQYGQKEYWFRYDQNGNLKECTGEYFVGPQKVFEQKAQKGELVALHPLSCDDPQIFNILGEHADLDQLRKSISSGEKDIAVPEMGRVIECGGLMRVKEGGHYEWYYCHPEGFGSSRWWARDHAAAEIRRSLEQREESRKRSLLKKLELLKDPQEMKATLQWGTIPVELRLTVVSGQAKVDFFSYATKREKADIERHLMKFLGTATTLPDAARMLLKLSERSTFPEIISLDDHDLQVGPLDDKSFTLLVNRPPYWWHKVKITGKNDGFRIECTAQTEYFSDKKDTPEFIADFLKFQVEMERYLRPVVEQARAGVLGQQFELPPLRQAALQDYVLKHRFGYHDADFRIDDIC